MIESDSKIKQEIKTVIITGANGNLGTVVTQLFLAKGYKVIATVITDEAKAELVSHNNLTVKKVDLTNEKEAALLVANSITEHGKIDAALLLAGGFAMGNIAKTRSADIKGQLALNFETAYHIAQPLLPHMLGNNFGRLVFIGSRPALEAKDGKNMIAYSLSKSLLFKLADCINAEAKGKNVTATVVVPSTLNTAPNRSSMPNANPADWVSTEAFAEILEFVVSEKGGPLRETVLKVYNNA